MERKTWVWALLSGAAIGEFLAVWLVPKYLVWYFEPPAAMSFSCREPIQWALGRLQTWLIVGLVAGGALGLLGWYLIRSRRNAPPSAPRR